MEVAIERDDALATRRTTCESHRGRCCFRTAIHQAHSLTTRYAFRNRLGQLHFARSRSTEGCPVAGNRSKGRGDCRMSVTQNDGSITLDEIDVALSLDIFDVGAFATSNDVRLAADCLECANRRVHTTWNDLRRALEQLMIRRNSRADARRRSAALGDATLWVAVRDRADGHRARSANQRAKYVRMMSAPARFTAVSCSIATPS